MSTSSQPTAALFVYVWPEPLSSAAGLRTHELARILQSEGYEVHAYSPCAPNAAMAAWENLGVRCHPCPANDSSVESFLKEISPALVLYDRFVMEEHFGWRLRTLWPAALHLVDTQDIHSLRRARERAAKRGEAEPAEADYGEDIVRELASLHRADACLVVSPVEKTWLAARGYPEDRVHYLPFSAAIEAAPPAFAERAGYCLLGNFRHAPNLDSVQFTVKEIWPRIRTRQPDATLFLYGAYPPAAVSALDGKNGVRVPGQVTDHRRHVARHRVLLAPLRFGAGIKGKVLEAWACGNAVAGTPVAFEGILAGAGVADPEALAESAVRLHENEEAWSDAAAEGRRALSGVFAPAAVRNSFLGFLAEAFSRKEEWRAQLTGRMLRLQANNATKYFSLWIEAKNKKGEGV